MSKIECTSKTYLIHRFTAIDVTLDEDYNWFNLAPAHTDDDTRLHQEWRLRHDRSGKHVRLTMNELRYILRDLDSLHGCTIMVRNNLISPDKSGRHIRDHRNEHWLNYIR